MQELKMHKSKTEKTAGFGAVGVVLIVVVVALVGFISWRVYDASKTKTSSTTTSHESTNTGSSQANSQTQTTDPYADWKTYTSSLAGYSIKYPSNWSVRTTTGDYESTYITSPDKFEVQLTSFTKDSKYGSSTLTSNPTGACGSTCLTTSTVTTFNASKYGTVTISADKQGAGGGSAYALDLFASGSSYITSPTKSGVTTTVTGNFQGWTEAQQTQETSEQFTGSSSVKTATQIYQSLTY